MATKKGAHTAPGTKWYATPEKNRKRKSLEVSVGIDARKALDDVASRFEVALSRVVCAALLELASLSDAKIRAAIEREKAAK